MTGFRHVTPSFRVVAGSGALDALARDLDRLGVKRAMTFTSGSMIRHGTALAGVETALGERLVGRFADTTVHSPLPVVTSAVSCLHAADADAVVVVGGGSAVVTARAAVILHGERADIRSLATHRDAAGRLVSPRLTAAKLPVWVVPSTPTTASAKAGAAVRDPATGERLALFDPAARAQGVFLDPGVAASAPPELVKSSSLNALAMAVESLQANARDPLADAPLLHAVTLIIEALPRLLDAPDDIDARLRLMSAALLCGQGTDFSGGGLAQSLAHAVGPRSHVANGVVEAILLPHAVRFNAIASAERLGRLAYALRHFGVQQPSAGSLAEHLETMLRGWRVPPRLRDVGVDRDVLTEAASHAMDDWAITQIPRAAHRDDLVELLEQAW